jgi:hypothetical protein
MKVFEIRWYCRNCGKRFIEKYEKGDEIESQHVGFYLKHHKCTGIIGCKYCRNILCPNCDSKNIDKRSVKPIKGK